MNSCSVRGSGNIQSRLQVIRIQRSGRPCSGNWSVSRPAHTACQTVGHRAACPMYVGCCGPLSVSYSRSWSTYPPVTTTARARSRPRAPGSPHRQPLRRGGPFGHSAPGACSEESPAGWCGTRPGCYSAFCRSRLATCTRATLNRWPWHPDRQAGTWARRIWRRPPLDSAAWPRGW